MRKSTMFFVLLVAALVFATPAFAQTGTSAGSTDLRPIAVGFGMAIAAGLCGLGQGRIAAAACEGLARNPGARGGIQISLILGLAFVESLVLFTFLMIYLKS